MVNTNCTSEFYKKNRQVLDIMAQNSKTFAKQLNLFLKLCDDVQKIPSAQERKKAKLQKLTVKDWLTKKSKKIQDYAEKHHMNISEVTIMMFGVKDIPNNYNKTSDADIDKTPQYALA